MDGWKFKKSGGHEEIGRCAIVLAFSNPPQTLKKLCGFNKFTQKPPKYNADSFHLTLPVNWLGTKGHTKIRNVLQHTWKTQAKVLLLRVNN
jgi:hypothetical protein